MEATPSSSEPFTPDSTTDPRIALAEILQLDTSPIGEPTLNMEFDSDQAAKLHYTAYAARAGFAIRMSKSRRSRKDDQLVMRRFVCTREGFHSAPLRYRGGYKRKRGTVREGCMAMMEVMRRDSGKWVVTKLVTDHTHLVALPGMTRPRIATTAVEILLVLKQSGGSGFSNNLNGGVRVNPFGEGGEAPGLLHYLKRMQAENPGFFYAVQVDNNNCITNVFWADARSRTAYQHFGDAVTFDTTYKKTKYMMPFAAFRGVNHHLRAVTFGCALLMDETKGSYVWLFETWLAAVGGRHPASLITDRDKAMEAAIATVFPKTPCFFCKWHVLSRCKQKLSDVYLKHPSLKRELRECVTESETVEEFQTRWEYLLAQYNLWDNQWLKSLYEIRQRWASVYQESLFFPELYPSQRPESLNKFFKMNFNTKTSLLVFVTQFDQAMTSQYETEAEADLALACSKMPLKTPSPMEKQAAEIYTNVVFGKFQEEFVESLGYYVDRIEDTPESKYIVTMEDNDHINYIVSFSESDKKASCSCCKFERSGILCRHILRVFFIVGIHVLPEQYILKRWTRNATSSAVLDEHLFVPGLSFQDYLVAWYNDICLDAIKYGVEGAISVDVYKIAKSALQKAFAKVAAAKNVQRKGQQNMQIFMRMQKMQYKMPLPRLQPKRTPALAAQQDEAGRSGCVARDDILDASDPGLNDDFR